MNKTLFLCLTIAGSVLGGAGATASGEPERADVPADRLSWSRWWAKPGFWQRRIDDARGDIARGSKEYDIVFCGDSNTQNWEGWRAAEDVANLRHCIAEGRITEERAFVGPRQAWLDLKKKYRVLNLGISGDCTQHLLWRLTKGGLLDGYKARYFCILIGANNCYHRDGAGEPENIVAGIRAIIASIREKHPEAKILLHKCTPTDRDPRDPVEVRHERVNGLLPALADGKRVILCDFTAPLKEKDGSQAKKCFADGLHLNEAGFRVWSAAVQEIVDADLSVNCIANGNWLTDNGIGLPLGWSELVADASSSLKVTPIDGGGLDFRVSGTSYIFYEQLRMGLKAGGEYRLSFEVKTRKLGKTRPNIVIRDNPGRKAWKSEQCSERFPEDTDGKWVKMEKDITLLPEVYPEGYRLTIMCSGGGTNTVDQHFAMRNLSLVARTKETAAETRPVAPEVLQCLKPRIVPIDPLLSAVDADAPAMEFYWPSRPICGVTNCRLTATLGTEKSEARFGADGRARVVWKKAKPGATRLSAWVSDAQGALVSSNSYPATVVRAAAARPPVGRRLNNFVAELVRQPLEDGTVTFVRDTPGWVWISFDDAAGEPEGYLDDAALPSVCRHPGERYVETQRYVAAGEHRLRITGAKSGRLRIHAVKTVIASLPPILSDTASTTYSGSFRYALPFFRHYGMLSAGNTTYHLDFNRPERTMYTSPEYLGLAFSRGMEFFAGIGLPPEDKLRDDVGAVYGRLAGPLWQLGVPIAIDENYIAPAPNRQVNFSEAVWRMVEAHPERRIGLYYADTARGRAYARPETQAAEISSIVNSGNGTGLLMPELYAPILPRREGLAKIIGGYADYLESAARFVPAARGHVVLYAATFNLQAHWCTYLSPQTDAKAHVAEMLRAFAVDPRFADSAGVGFGGAMAGDEEIRRWGLMCLRYYALEGGTEDLAAKYGFAWAPGWLRDGDFEAGLDNWTASGAVAAETIAGYGRVFQTRKDMTDRSTVGDTMATFATQPGKVNSLSQRLTGLVPGRYYSAFCCVSEIDGLTVKKYVPPTCDFSIRMEGATEVPRLRYELCRGQRGKIKAAGNVEKVLRFHVLRYVFKAEAAEATLILQDRDDKNSVPKSVMRQAVNFVMFKPYYLEAGESPESVADALQWRTDDRKR